MTTQNSKGELFNKYWTAAALIGALNDLLGKELDINVFYDYSSIAALSAHLTSAPE